MYSSYEFYKEFRSGQEPSLDANNYNFYAAKANDFIIFNTNELVEDLQVLSLMLEKLKKAECEIAELLYKFENEDYIQSTNKTGENQDGHSVTYRDAAAKKSERQARTKDVLIAYLTVPVNLIYGGR